MKNVLVAPPREWGYRPAIDGLRSIAVLSVLLFHFDRRLLPGGFVGVDVFFVISGYLITSILLEDIARDAFSIVKFYQRRIARIFPAFFVVIGATAAVAAFAFVSQDLASLGASASAAALSVINLKLMFQGSYFKLPPDAQPLLHYWSLAVEEQFYMLFPVYLWFLTRWTRRPLAVNALVCVASLVACVVLTALQPVYAFYLLPTRAWELLAGASLAMYERRAPPLSSPAASVISFAGFLLLVGSFALIEETQAFPGWGAAFPVAGAALLLAVASSPDAPATRLLSWRPAVFVGKLSYSLYLWHWPTFSLVDYALFESSFWIRASLKLGITLVASYATWRYVEGPARRWLNARPHRLQAFAGMAVCVALATAAGVYVRNNYYLNASPGSIASGGILVPGGERGTVVLSGDSQASMYGKPLADLARAEGFTLNIVSVAGGAQLPGEAGTSWPDVKRFIAQRRPDVVILADAWYYKTGDDPARLREALDDLAGHAGRVIVMAQLPVLPLDALRENIRAGSRGPYREIDSQHEARLRAEPVVAQFASERVSIVDVADILMLPDGTLRVRDAAGRLTWHDQTHLSDAGTALVMPALKQEILRAFAAARQTPGRGAP